MESLGRGRSLVPSNSPWPQEWVVTHMFLPDHTNTAFVNAHILKGQQLLKVKTFVWIGANMTSEKEKEQNGATEQCASTSYRKWVKVGRKKEKCVFFSSATQIEQEVHVSESGSAVTALDKSDKKMYRVKSDALFPSVCRLKRLKCDLSHFREQELHFWMYEKLETVSEPGDVFNLTGLI